MFIVDTKPDKAPTWVPGRSPSRTSGGGGPPAGSPQRATQHPTSSVPASTIAGARGEVAAISTCPVCFDDVPSSRLLRLEACGHGFCYTCLREYCTMQVRLEW